MLQLLFMYVALFAFNGVQTQRQDFKSLVWKRARVPGLDLNRMPSPEPPEEHNAQIRPEQSIIPSSLGDHSSHLDLQQSVVSHNQEYSSNTAEEKRARKAELERQRRKKYKEICNGTYCGPITEEERLEVKRKVRKHLDANNSRVKQIRMRWKNGNPTESDKLFYAREKRARVKWRANHKDQVLEQLERWHTKHPSKKKEYASAFRQRLKAKLEQGDKQ